MAVAYRNYDGCILAYASSIREYASSIPKLRRLHTGSMTVECKMKVIGGGKIRNKEN
ncbi:MAG: hypothetical protein LBV64_04565 [Mediterranea sp.]|nr:hypothetical protein [Mediterranea sp.]